MKLGTRAMFHGSRWEIIMTYHEIMWILDREWDLIVDCHCVTIRLITIGFLDKRSVQYASIETYRNKLAQCFSKPI
jgi:hypothetical protein